MPNDQHNVDPMLQELIREIHAAFSQPAGDTPAEVEYTSADFERLARLPFAIPDVPSNEDDDL